jgi:MFS transporter, DHA1 family, inner membrane transport protein
MRSVMTVLAIWCAGLGAAAQFGKLSVTFPALSAAYAAQSAIGIGVILSVVGFVGLVFGTTAGLLVARVGPRRAIVWALGLGAVLGLVQSGFPSYPLMVVTRILEGVSHLAIVVVGPTVIAGLAVPRWQGAAMTLWSSFFGVAYAGLFYLGPDLLALHGAEGLFRLHAGWMAISAAVLALLLPRDPAPARHGVRRGLWAEHLAIYASPVLAAPAMGFACYTVTYVAVLTLLPALMGDQGGFIGVAMPLVSIAVSLTLGVWLLSRMRAVHLVQAGFVVAAVCALLLFALWETDAAVVPALGVAACLGLVQGASFAALAELNPLAEDRARAAGAVAQLGNLGTTTGTPLLIWLLSVGDVAGLTVFLVGFSALGVVIHAVQARRRAEEGMEFQPMDR